MQLVTEESSQEAQPPILHGPLDGKPKAYRYVLRQSRKPLTVYYPPRPHQPA